MLSIKSALEIIHEYTPGPQVEERRLKEAQGLHLATQLHAPEPFPRFNSSAMDGYAVALPEDFSPDQSLLLPVVGESRAGTPWQGSLEAGTAVEISTGAWVPEGTDQVIPVEDTSREGDQVRVKSVPPGQRHIRLAGKEVQAGDVIAAERTRLTPPVIAWLAGFGIDRVPVFIPPRAVLITTGDELVEPGQTRRPGQSWNTNRLFLEGLLAGSGAELTCARHIPDDLKATIHALDEAGNKANIIAAVGGVSVGEHDHVRPASEQAGFAPRFWQVAQKPGKPLYFATRGNTMLFGLPGNPVSAVLTSLLYLYPALKRLLGHPHPQLATIPGRFHRPLTNLKPGRAKLMPVSVTGHWNEVTRIQPGGPLHSHMLSIIVKSDGFVIIPGDKTTVPESEIHTVFLFPWSDIQRLQPASAKD